MGARSSPEGYRVAVARYGLPVQMRTQALRRLRIAGLIAVAATAAGCSHVTGSKSSKNGKPVPCTFIAKLDQIASTVATADVHNPDTFKKTLDTAVHDYVENVRSLRALAPVELRTGLTRVEADVQQYRFDAALTDRGGARCVRGAHVRPGDEHRVDGRERRDHRVRACPRPRRPS